MSCDLTDPNIPTLHASIASNEATNWLLLGYRDTRDKISVYGHGSGGLSELVGQIPVEEVLYALLRLDGGDADEEGMVLIVYVPESVSGVRRARALVHGRAVSALLSGAKVQVSVSKMEELTEAGLRARLRAAAAADGGSSMAAAAVSPPNSKGPLSGKSPNIRPARVATPEDTSAMEAERLRKLEAEEKRVREEAAWQAKMALAQAEQARAGGIQGYVTYQGKGNYVWRRRWCVIKDGKMSLFRTARVGEPALHVIELKGMVESVEEATRDVLIGNSWRVWMKEDATPGKPKEPWVFFADDVDTRDRMMAGIMTSK